MSHIETVNQDTRAYRQGLVLGLTMAEVFLLLVFALLIAFAALWNSERDKRRAAEEKLGGPPAITAADKSLLDKVKDVIATAGADKVTKALDHLTQGRDLEPLSKPEREFVETVRRQHANAKPQTISDNWRELSRAAQPLDKLKDRLDMGDAVTGALPEGEKTPGRAKGLIGTGLAAEKKGEHDWPPIINLSEARRRTFEIGKAELSEEFEKHLRDVIVPVLEKLAVDYKASIIEVIGHTDETKIAPRPSNLDAMIVDVVTGSSKVGGLIPADNAGLGLARAAAVMRVLTADGRLKPYTVLPLSAGQLIAEGDKVTVGGGGDDKNRRRIEIRIRRANSPEPPSTDAKTVR